jgi:VanZ family protein
MAARIPVKWWLTALAWMALAGQLWVLYTPTAPDSVAVSLPFADKMVHGGIFALAVWAWTRRWRRWAWVIAALFATHGVISEVIQSRLLPNRTGDAWDVVADLAGVALGLWAALRWRWPPDWVRPDPAVPPDKTRPHNRAE